MIMSEGGRELGRWGGGGGGGHVYVCKAGM